MPPKPNTKAKKGKEKNAKGTSDKSSTSETRGRPMNEAMTEEMHKEVTALYPAFDNEVLKRPLMTTVDQAEVLQWKREKCDSLLGNANGAFKDCLLINDLSGWKAVSSLATSFSLAVAHILLASHGNVQE